MTSLSYEQWDMVADSYIPILFLIALLWMFFDRWRQNKKYVTVLFAFAPLVLMTGFCYLFMYIDKMLDIWPAYGLDYSTHTALAVTLVFFLVSCKPRIAPVWLTSIVMYVLLMLYQNYHTIADILSTALLVVAMCFGVNAIMKPRSY